MLTVLIEDDAPAQLNSAVAEVCYTITFSQPILVLDSQSLQIQNGSISDISGDGRIWTVSVVPDANVDNDYLLLSLLGSSLEGAGGETVSDAGGRLIPLDTKAPVEPKIIAGDDQVNFVNPQVSIDVRLGSNFLGEITLELYPDAAPETVANFVSYVDTSFYDSTIFHRVVEGFVVQGGGLEYGMVSKPPTYSAIPLESNNGLSNVRGTVAMARTSVPDSATSQFFINLVDNAFLDYLSESSPGYAVFGRVVSGMESVDLLATIDTINYGQYSNVPAYYLFMDDVTLSRPGESISQSASFLVGNLEEGSSWDYSLDSGVSWRQGSGSTFSLPEGRYPAGSILVRQTDENGNISNGSGTFYSSISVDDNRNTSLVNLVGSSWSYGEGELDIYRSAGEREEFNLTTDGHSYWIEDSSGTYGNDRLIGIERLQFTDRWIALDLDGHAGETAKILSAVFGSEFISDTVYVGIGLSLLDSGVYDFASLIEYALYTAGATNNEDVVRILYSNIVGVAPTPDQAAPFVAMLEGDNPQHTWGSLGVMATDFVDITGLQTTGLEYTPFG